MSSSSLDRRFAFAAHSGPLESVAKPVAERDWHVRYARGLIAVDAITITTAIATAYFLRFGNDLSETVVGTSSTYSSALILVGLIWWGFLGIRDSRDRSIVGHGLEEYRRVLSATLYAFGAIAIGAFIFQIELSRAFFLGLVPLGAILLTAGRWLARQELHRRRSRGGAMTRTIVVGGEHDVAEAVQDLTRNKQAGYRPVAVAVNAKSDQPADGGDLPMVRIDHVDRLAAEGKVGAVVVAGGLPRSTVRRLAWRLENSPVELMFVPWLTDVAGPRLTIRQVQDLSLTQVELPKYSGWNHVLKRAFDIAFAATAIVALSPILALIALLVKREDGGPVLFRQERIGHGGQPFQILKFRTMHVDAEARLASLISRSGADGPLFKMENDPRITKIGRILRKYSLDELPQFFNALGGSMSVVGPRPHLAHELEQYPHEGLRRLLIKPGVTGLWQVSGRSDLSFEQSVRLDLRYVENWSLIGDVTIILKTVRTVVRPTGAY